MSEKDIKGTNISSPIVPFTTDDTYPTHEARYGKGGFRTVSEIADLNRIPEARLEEGMLVYVINDPNKVIEASKYGEEKNRNLAKLLILASEAY